MEIPAQGHLPLPTVANDPGAYTLQGPVTTAAQPFTEDKFAGSVLSDRYRVLSLIGKGGMGSVYKAEHTALGKLMAVKVLRADLLSNELTVRRFEQEAKATGKLAHPNLVSVTDYGVTADGAPYLVMDFVDGKGLAEILCKEMRVEPDRVIDIFIQLCDALACAHATGVIHRDLKPSNIILRQGRDGGDWVKIVDFGIAKLLSEVQDEQNLTLTGEVCGSPLYMSPEQCMGHKMDARSDIYSLACVMYEAITGYPPFAGDTPMQTMYKHIHEQAPEFGSDFKHVPPALETVVLRALEKNMDHRYQTMLDMKRDLMLVKDGVKLPSLKAQRFLNRKEVRKRLIIYPSAILLGLWLGLTAGIWNSLETVIKPTPWKKLTTMANAQIRVGNTDLAEHFYLKALNIAQVEHAPDADRANIMSSLGDLYLNLSVSEQDDRRKVLALKEFEAAAALAKKDERLLGYVLERQGDCLHDMNYHVRAHDIYSQALSVRESSEGKEHYDVSVVLMKMGKNLITQSAFSEAKPYLLRAYSIQLKTLSTVHPDVSTCLALLGKTYMAEHDYEKADRAYQMAIAERQKLSGTQTRMLVSMLTDRVELLHKMGRPQEAKKLEERLAGYAR